MRSEPLLVPNAAMNHRARINGRPNTASRARVFICRPSSAQYEESCARKILARLSRRAFRRAVTNADIQPLLTFYHAGRREGDFDHGIEKALRAILVSPDFLFRIERDPAGAMPGTVYRVSDMELASRLSFFLWSSIPDERLLTLAEGRRLHLHEVLNQQVRRMLADPHADAVRLASLSSQSNRLVPSPDSGCIYAIWRSPSLTRTYSRNSMRPYANLSLGKQTCFLNPSCGKTAACSTY